MLHPNPVNALLRLASSLVLLTLAGCASTGTASRTPAAAAVPEFETYQLVLLRRGPAWTPEKTPEIAKLQAQHLGHLTAMAESGRMVAAGPFGDQDDETLRGLCLYRVGSVDAARALAEQDPMVQSGRLRVEVMTWYTEKGYVTFPKAPPLQPAP